MIKFGIFGAGGIAGVMSKTIRMMNESGDTRLQLYGIASRSMEKAEEFAKKNGVMKAYGSYEDMASDPDIDLIYIAVPHSHHYETVKLCLAHDKATLVEKAFTANAKQAKELIALAEEKNVFITEAIWTRYQPMRRMINETLKSGIVGEPKLLCANRGQPLTHVPRLVRPELAGGALLDLGVYALNFAEMVFGRTSSVHAVCTKNENGVDMNEACTLTFENGRMAALCSSAETVLDNDGVIYCTKGYIRVRNINNPEAMTIYGQNHQLIKTVRAPEKLTGYEYQLREVIEALEAGKTECASMPHAETVHIMELMDEIRRQLGVKYPFENDDRKLPDAGQFA